MSELAATPTGRAMLIVACSALVPNPEQVKRHVGTEAFARLVENIRLHGILQPITLKRRPDGKYDVISGNGRALAAIELKLAGVPAQVLSDGDTDTAVFVVVENVLRTDLTPAQLLEGLEAIKATRPTWLNKDIAARVGMSEGRISQFFVIGSCPEARERLTSGELSVNEAYNLAKAAPEARAGMLALKAAGASSQEVIAAAARKKPSPPPVVDKTGKPKRIAMPLPKAKASVSITGEIASVDSLINVLTEALELARKSLRENHSLSTATRAWADRVKAGGTFAN